MAIHIKLLASALTHNNAVTTMAHYRLDIIPRYLIRAWDGIEHVTQQGINECLGTRMWVQNPAGTLNKDGVPEALKAARQHGHS